MKPIHLALVATLSFGIAHAGAPSERYFVRRFVDAVGGKAALKRVSTVRLSSDDVESGVAGKIDEWISQDGYRRETLQGTDRRIEVCDPDSCWVKDWNGKVSEVAGRDLADQRTVVHLKALLFAGAPARAIEASVTKADDTATILRVSPPGGAPYDLFIDKKTALPTKAVRRYFGVDVTTEIGDWRRVDKLLVPFSLRETTADPDDAPAAIVREVALAAALPTGAFSRPDEGVRDFGFAEGDRALGIPFNFENDHIMVACTVNGSKPIWFMLDTGAESNYINKTRLAEFGLTPFGSSSVTGGGNTAEGAFARVARLGIGGAELRGQRDAVLDLTGLEKIYGMPLGGLLGFDFFSRFIVEIDYDNLTMSLYDPATYVHEGKGAPLRFINEGGHPHVVSEIGVRTQPRLPADMVIDAGAADTVNLASPFVRKHDLLKLARKKPAGDANTLPGSEKEFFAQTSVRARLERILLGPFELKDIPMNLMVAKTGAYGSESFSGTIGEGILRRFKTIYDYPRGTIYLEPNAEFAKPFPSRKTFGTTFLSDGADFTVFKVTGIRKGSAAETAGLKTGDVITAVDGKPASEIRLGELRKLLLVDDSRHALEVQRGDETLQLDATVKLVSLDD
jgi:hypothetical protein